MRAERRVSAHYDKRKPLTYCVKYSEFCRCITCLNERQFHADIVPEWHAVDHDATAGTAANAATTTTFENHVIKKSIQILDSPPRLRNQRNDSSSRVLPLAEIYKEERRQQPLKFGLASHQTTVHTRTSMKASDETRRSGEMDRTRANTIQNDMTIREEHQHSSASSSSSHAYHQSINHFADQSALLPPARMSEKYNRNLGVGLSRVSTSGYNFSFSLNNISSGGDKQHNFSRQNPSFNQHNSSIQIDQVKFK